MLRAAAWHLRRGYLSARLWRPRRRDICRRLLCSLAAVHHLRDMTERLHHMIFHRRDADAKLLMYLAICEFVHPVHQEDAPGFGRHGVDGRLVESRSEERRVGKEGVSKCRYRWARDH